MPKKKIRYAVIGQGYISQIAVLPAFRHAAANSKLEALVSDDPTKLKKLGQKYKVRHLLGYDQYDELLEGGGIDAVYISLPNHLHHDYALRAAKAGVHVLCEKPLAPSVRECEEMIRGAEQAGIKFMTAYRLHFEAANLSIAQMIKSGKLGDPKIFNSTFTIAVDQKNYRANPREQGGGPTYDVGIYCINAARYLFRDEPIEVSARSFGVLRGGESDAEEAMAVTLKFSDEKVASFVCGFRAFPTKTYQIVGTKGVVTLENAYEYTGDKKLLFENKKTTQRRTFPKRDQFGAELLYFSNCILKNKTPEPSGLEGLIDVRIIEAIFESAESGRPVKLEPISKAYPSLEQSIRLPATQKPKLIRVKGPSQEEAA